MTRLTWFCIPGSPSFLVHTLKRSGSLGTRLQINELLCKLYRVVCGNVVNQSHHILKLVRQWEFPMSLTFMDNANFQSHPYASAWGGIYSTLLQAQFAWVLAIRGYWDPAWVLTQKWALFMCARIWNKHLGTYLRVRACSETCSGKLLPKQIHKKIVDKALLQSW